MTKQTSNSLITEIGIFGVQASFKFFVAWAILSFLAPDWTTINTTIQVIFVMLGVAGIALLIVSGLAWIVRSTFRGVRALFA